MVASLFEHERISTTMEKAKEVRAFAERLITLAKKGDLASRRRAISLLGRNRDIVTEEEGEFVKKGTVVGKLFSDIAPRYLDRPGGYTRIIKLAMNRLGDNGQVVLLQLVGDEKGEEKTKRKPNKRARRAEALKAITVKKGKKEKAAAVKKEEPKEVEQSEDKEVKENG
jgi:large subunit ribosomal protein L17